MKTTFLLRYNIIVIFCILNSISRLEQQTYMHLLQRYLETKHSSKCEAISIYLKLMRFLEELRVLKESNCYIKLDIEPEDVGLLLTEFFDLKHKSNFFNKT